MVDLLRHGWPPGTAARLYRLLKYLVYVLLSLNIWFFLQEELVSATHAATAETDFFTWVQLFSATLDTAAWVLLLLLFELETAVIPDERLVGKTKWTIHGIRLLCGCHRLGFFGYFGEWTVFWRRPCCHSPPASWSIRVGRYWWISTTLRPGTQLCQTMGPDTVLVTGLERVIATPAALGSAYQLGLWM